MLGNDWMETTSTEVTSIRRLNDIEKTTWRTHQYFVDFESRIHVEISTSNRCHNFHVDSPFKIDEISTNFPRGISTSNRWWIDEDVSIGFIYPSIKSWNNPGRYFISQNYASVLKSRTHHPEYHQPPVEQKDNHYWLNYLQTLHIQ